MLKMALLKLNALKQMHHFYVHRQQLNCILDEEKSPGLSDLRSAAKRLGGKRRRLGV
jgi:hypothetical protein